MEQQANDPNGAYPLLFIPKTCTQLETNCDASDNVFIDLTITSPDTDGNETRIYSGFCNIKLIDTYDVNVQEDNPLAYEDIDDQTPVIIASQEPALPNYSQAEVWIDPSRSPFVYNRCDALESQTHYSVCHQTHTTSGHITVEQHNTYITKNVFNYNEAVHYGSPDEADSKKYVDVRSDSKEQVSAGEANIYQDEEIECGLFLSQLPEEIMYQKKNKEREERKYIDMNCDNRALKQLMSSDVQSASKQRKTILFLGQDSERGQTIQKIAYTDPLLKCSGSSKDEDMQDQQIILDDTIKQTRHKKYQCAKCSQIFKKISDFRDHMVNHPRNIPRLSRFLRSDDENYSCLDCGKLLKSKEKYEMHCLGHGNPELECNVCKKVFASKFTLRAHAKLHNRRFSCNHCSKTFMDVEIMKAHVLKKHRLHACKSCDFVASNQTDLNNHQEIHDIFYGTTSSETDLAESLFDDVISENSVDGITPSPECKDWKVEEVCVNVTDLEQDSLEELGDKEPDESCRLSDIMPSDIFDIKKGKSSRRYNKTCRMCLKTFDRMSDLKRHLIEHVIRTTLANTPVNKSGKLQIQCEVCHTVTFNKIDKYKAHLREHAKLTLYQCTFCNKSFSDSSNFSKHKKIHGVTYFQCDLCKRKFNTRQMITQHMEYHNRHPPLPCCFCKKEFHFESMLNKHIRSAHTKELISRFRCRFCHEYFKTLKEKWDHEWRLHNARKIIADCLLCGAKFRKYSELKRHCADKHGMEIPTAKKLLKT